MKKPLSIFNKDGKAYHIYAPIQYEISIFVSFCRKLAVDRQRHSIKEMKDVINLIHKSVDKVIRSYVNKYPHLIHRL
jgi:hypothetical protein